MNQTTMVQVIIIQRKELVLQVWCTRDLPLNTLHIFMMTFDVLCTFTSCEYFSYEIVMWND